MTCKKALGYLIVSSPFVGIYVYGAISIGLGPISIIVAAAMVVTLLLRWGAALITSD